MAPERRASLPALIAAFAVIYLVWGSTYLANRAVVAALPPLLARAGCCLAAGAMLYAWSRARGAPAPTARLWLAAVPSGFLLFAGCQGLLSVSQLHVSSGIAAVLIATVPLWLPLLAWATPGGVAPSRAVLGSAALGMLGVAVLGLGPGAAAGLSPLWAGIVLLSALSWAVGTVLLRTLPRPAEPLLGAGMGLLLGGLMLVPIALLAGERPDLPPSLPGTAIAGLLWTVFANYLLAFGCYTWLLTVCPAPLVATYAYVNPPIALALGWAFAGEALTASLLLGVGPILLAVMLAVSAPATAPLGRSQIRPTTRR